ncbi:Rpr2-domain-containing protein [Hypomontagnella monticulosa]|nr:Rpr2-domain-containing protein [Hypomontagnella monticulosa]
MGKPKGPGSIPNRPIYSRISYLYQAAAYLANQPELKGPSPDTQISKATEEGNTSQHVQTSHSDDARYALSRRFITDLRSASLKSQIRLSPAMKQTICKFCDSLLIEGETSSSTVENPSKGGKKPWADVLVITCHTCGGMKRFPVQASRQKRRPIREKESKEKRDQKNREIDISTEGD